jgi:hypothetical protein
MFPGALVELSLTEGKLAVIFATAINVPRGIGNVTLSPTHSSPSNLQNIKK